jgi:hypothetical protein
MVARWLSMIEIASATVDVCVFVTALALVHAPIDCEPLLAPLSSCTMVLRQRTRASRSVLSCLALACVVAALGGCAEDPVTTRYVVAGHVTDATTGAGITGAAITFVADTLYTDATKTDSSGDYEMTVESDVPFGQVRAERDGYVAAETTVYFDTLSRRIDLVLRRASPPEMIDM